jgi:hypothetical protein
MSRPFLDELHGNRYRITIIDNTVRLAIRVKARSCHDITAVLDIDTLPEGSGESHGRVSLVIQMQTVTCFDGVGCW